MASRKFPLRQPPNHKPPPRLHLQFPDGMRRVFTAYIGVQVHSRDNEEKREAHSLLNEPRAQIQKWLSDPTNAPTSVERFLLLDDSPNHRQLLQTQSNRGIDPGPGAPAIVWVCYWTNEAKYNASTKSLRLQETYRGFSPALQPYIGFWSECFASEVRRLETVYSATDYLPGLASLPGTSTAQHVHTGYWGAARDRIPGSSDDLFEADPSAQDVSTSSGKIERQQEILGASVVGTNPHNMVHIRSGQFWANCEGEERRNYIDSLEPKLRRGLDYLWQFPEESGSSAVRYLMNMGESECPSAQVTGTPIQTRDEACVTGFFKSMSHLENWAARNRSHLVIHAGAINHAKKFDDDRKFRTWHEVSVLQGGDARFEYVNCLPGTGAMREVVTAGKDPL